MWPIVNSEYEDTHLHEDTHFQVDRHLGDGRHAGATVAREGMPLKGMVVARMPRHAFTGIWATDSPLCLSRQMAIYPYAYRVAKTDRMPCLYTCSHMTIDYSQMLLPYAYHILTHTCVM